ncbi:hypothetical protein LTR78_003139 [Recurvomyces mirabilis]|uniref:BTB domain-containing protein n=1 Tax=Recurvomyces mirabilis TaxID=574656 RepID=A0AAE0WSC1_9PEZI|nr:hypothetical protein LTR78_003139 [Recurvomyces mirabilis]KAK5157040.1 hypothetical protein LTS14_004557 [Recurvomyces mirabilis]
MASASEAAILDGIAQAYKDKEYADLEIICADKTWKAHKLVLCKQSDFFKKACSGDFKEGKQNKIELPDDDKQAVDAILAFLYTHKYGDEGNSQSDTSPMSLDIRVFTIADKYFIEPLKVYAASKFQPRTTGEWKSPEFAQAIEELYTAGPPTDRSLRNMVLSVVRDNVDELYGNKDQYAAFHKIISSIGDFAADVAESLARPTSFPRT